MWLYFVLDETDIGRETDKFSKLLNTVNHYETRKNQTIASKKSTETIDGQNQKIKLAISKATGQV